MLVAKFGASTAWVGREIIWDVDRFILVGHGQISAAGVLEYERLGQLVWARPELRAWVAAVHRWETGAAWASASLPMGAAWTSGQVAAGAWAGGQATGATWAGAQPATLSGGVAAPKRRLPTWALVLIVVVVALFVLGPIVAAIAIPTLANMGETVTNDALVRTGVETIQAGIESYAFDHGGRYPAEVSVVTLGSYIPVWPENPYTGAPMVNTVGEGDFLYTADGMGGYTLVGYGRGGTVVVDLSEGQNPTY